jgi:hypothetical protein
MSLSFFLPINIEDQMSSGASATNSVTGLTFNEQMQFCSPNNCKVCTPCREFRSHCGQVVRAHRCYSPALNVVALVSPVSGKQVGLVIGGRVRCGKRNGRGHRGKKHHGHRRH